VGALGPQRHSNAEVLQEEDMKHRVFNKASKLRAALTSLKLKEVQGSTNQACSSGEARRCC
jgi:hypothetical protein